MERDSSVDRNTQINQQKRKKEQSNILAVTPFFFYESLHKLTNTNDCFWLIQSYE